MMFKFLALVALLAVVVFAGPLPRRNVREYPLFPRLSGRIINGTATTIEKNPHQISVQHKDYGHLCGGSIISKNWLVTAAHCTGFETNEYIILAGTENLFEGGSRHRVSEVIPHERFHFTVFGTMENDLALIKVSDPFVFDAKQKSIELNDNRDDTRAGTIASVTGWGSTDADELSTILNIVEIPIISKRRCNELYEFIGGIHIGEICAGYEEGGKDACQGDSGGPLTVNGRLAGVVSWGYECAVAGQPGVYTEIAYHREWIKKHSDV